MADSATTDVSAQAQAVGGDLLSELQAAASGQITPPAAPAQNDASGPSTVTDVASRTKQRMAQVAQDTYWAPRRQMEQGIAARKAQAAGRQAEERIAQLKQQISA